jgi:hypothetical protein
MIQEQETFSFTEWKEVWDSSTLAAVHLGLLHEGIPRMLAHLQQKRSRATRVQNKYEQREDYIRMIRFYLDVIHDSTSHPNHVLAVREKALAVLIEKALCSEQIDDLMDEPDVARDVLRVFQYDRCGVDWVRQMLRGHRLMKVQDFLRHAFYESVVQASKGMSWTYAEPQDFIRSLARMDVLPTMARAYRLTATMPSTKFMSELKQYVLTEERTLAYYWKDVLDQREPVLLWQGSWMTGSGIAQRPETITEALARGQKAALAYTELEAISTALEFMHESRTQQTIASR